MIGTEAKTLPSAESLFRRDLARIGRLLGPRSLRRAAYALLFLGVAIEAVLGLRLWAQLSSKDLNAGLLGFFYDLSGPLVAPFRSLEPAAPIKSTGIFEFATLAAIEAYLVAMLAIIFVLIIVPVLFVVLRGLVKYLVATDDPSLPASRPTRRAASRRA